MTREDFARMLAARINWAEIQKMAAINPEIEGAGAFMDDAVADVVSEYINNGLQYLGGIAEGRAIIKYFENEMREVA